MLGKAKEGLASFDLNGQEQYYVLAAIGEGFALSVVYACQSNGEEILLRMDRNKKKIKIWIFDKGRPIPPALPTQGHMDQPETMGPCGYSLEIMARAMDKVSVRHLQPLGNEIRMEKKLI